MTGTFATHDEITVFIENVWKSNVTSILGYTYEDDQIRYPSADTDQFDTDLSKPYISMFMDKAGFKSVSLGNRALEGSGGLLICVQAPMQDNYTIGKPIMDMVDKICGSILTQARFPVSGAIVTEVSADIFVNKDVALAKSSHRAIIDLKYTYDFQLT